MRNITFINAGAGSGKTYRLTTKLARMLTQEGLDPSQVILTTFTELAAAEFREKARKEILNAKDQYGNPIEANIRIKNATQLDNAFIGTVHSISYRFIRKYWYLLDYGADIQPMSDQNKDFYMSQSISKLVTEKDRQVFRKFCDTFDIKDMGKPDHLFWLPQLKEIVDKLEYYDIESVDESIQKSKETAKQVFHGGNLEDLFSIIETFIGDLETYLDGLNAESKVDRYKAAIKKITTTVNGSKIYKINSIDDLKTGNGKETILDEVGRGKVKNAFYSRPEYQNAKLAYDEFAISKDYLPIVEEYLDTIFNLAVSWRAQLTAYKKENHIITFDDMEKIFLDMLTEEKYKEVQDDIACNFSLLMVDEFQDSNPIQLKIFNRISELIAPKGGHSYWVGDPKQAIYGFRGSDSRFIAEILKKFEFSDDGTAILEHGDNMLGTDQLLESWRSRPALVEFANKIFLQPFMNSGLKEKQITLEPHFTRESDTLGEAQALYIWRTEDDKNGPKVKMLAKKIKDLAAAGQNVHHQSCDKEPSKIEYRDIAVLCHTNSQCNEIASALRQIGLPASCEETHLLQCKEIYLLKTLLLFVQSPTDKMLRAELAMLLDDETTANILNNRIQYVNSCNTEEKGWDKWMDAESGHDHSELISRYTAFTRRYNSLSVYDTVTAIIEELDLGNIILKWGDETQRKHNLSTVVNMAKAYDSMCEQMGIGSSIMGFINYLTITKPENSTDNSANAIKVLTYHRSKGLEWPVVILYSLWDNFNVDKDLAKKNFTGVNVCESEGQETDVFSREHYIHLFPKGMGGSGDLPEKMLETIVGNEEEGPNKIDAHPLFKTIKLQNKEEFLRLLYVGVTRAKDILISVTAKERNGEEISEWPKQLGISEGHSDKPWGDGYDETLEELVISIMQTDNPNDTPKYKTTTNTPGTNDAPLLVLSPSNIHDFGDIFTKNEKVSEADERIIDMKVFAGESSDAVRGSCIHDIFAAYEPNDLEGSLKRATQILANYGFPNALQAQKEKIILSIQWLHKYLAEHFGPATRIEKEYPLLYPLATGQILRGEIDLQWYYLDKNDGKEKCVLIDYKTFPGKREMLEEHTAKYYAQLSAYRAALTGSGVTVADTLIYYPIQGQVRRLLK